MAAICGENSGIPKALDDEAEDAGTDAEPEQGGADRQSHRQHGAEGQHQDDHCRQYAEHFAFGQCERLEELTAVLDLQTGRARHRFAKILDVVRQLQRVRLAALRHTELGE